MNNMAIALEIMAKGMGGIFVAIFVIMLAVIVLGKKLVARRTNRNCF